MSWGSIKFVNGQTESVDFWDLVRHVPSGRDYVRYVTAGTHVPTIQPVEVVIGCSPNGGSHSNQQFLSSVDWTSFITVHGTLRPV
jgi:hypothetical protein